MKCKKCEKIQEDPNTGMLICLTCGAVIEESHIAVNSLEFDDNQNAAGTFVDINKPSAFYPGGRNISSQNFDPTQRNINKTYKLMERTAKALIIPDYVVKTAKTLYNMASNKKFTQGRKTDLIVGAILYLACRIKNTEHLLIDFSEVLRINLFLIGSLYIKLLKLLSIYIPIKDDPSMFMHRFCCKFNFGLKAKEVEDTAKKILQFMKRDWIITGRRPSGLCGACILISAKLHKLNIDVNTISRVVHVSSQTILNRIEEFSLTKVASMSMEEFAVFNESHFYPGADPPAFLKKLKDEEKEENGSEMENKEKKIENGSEIQNKEEKIENGSEIQNKEEKIENGENAGINIDNSDAFTFKVNNSGLIKKNKYNTDLSLRLENSGLSRNNYNSDIFTFRPENSGLSRNNNDSFILRKMNSGLSRNNNDSNNVSFSLRSNNSGNNRSFRINNIKQKSTADEKLSCIPDNEDYKYIYSKNEYEVRKQFWEIMFRDWMEQQKEKEEKEGKEKKINTKEPKRRIKKNIFKSDGTSRSAYEAIKSCNKFGKKMNYTYAKIIMSKK